MGLKSVFKSSAKKSFDIWNWFGYTRFKFEIQSLARLLKSLLARFSSDKSSAETFEQAMTRQGLTEADLKKRIRLAKQLYLFFLVGTLAMLYYTFVQFTHGFIANGFFCILLTALLAVYGFREHFYSYQIRKRQLGCRYRDWFKDTIKRG
jgi:intracellular multiplication protein IcmV